MILYLHSLRFTFNKVFGLITISLCWKARKIIVLNFPGSTELHHASGKTRPMTKKYNMLIIVKECSKSNLLQDCSSDPSGQSSSPSQRQWPWTQVPSVQRNIFPEQTGIGRIVVKHLFSSELSAQSGSPSHFHRDGIQFWLSQVNWSSLQVLASTRKRKAEKSDKWHIISENIIYIIALSDTPRTFIITPSTPWPHAPNWKGAIGLVIISYD